ncbi:hypothetical protein Tco_0605375 [Tanacetum coccineum]
MVNMVPHEAFACSCAEGDVVLRQSYKPESYASEATYQQHDKRFSEPDVYYMLESQEEPIIVAIKYFVFLKTRTLGFPYHVVKVLMLSIITETDMQAIYQEMEKQEASDKAFEEQPQSHEVFRKERNTFSANDKFKSCTKSRSAAMRGTVRKKDWGSEVLLEGREWWCYGFVPSHGARLSHGAPLRESEDRRRLIQAQKIAEDMKVLQIDTSGMDPTYTAIINAQKERIRA